MRRETSLLILFSQRKFFNDGLVSFLLLTCTLSKSTFMCQEQVTVQYLVFILLIFKSLTSRDPKPKDTIQVLTRPTTPSWKWVEHLIIIWHSPLVITVYNWQSLTSAFIKLLMMVYFLLYLHGPFVWFLVTNFRLLKVSSYNGTCLRYFHLFPVSIHYDVSSINLYQYFFNNLFNVYSSVFPESNTNPPPDVHYTFSSPKTLTPGDPHNSST